jgi:hypothetical protein
MLLRPSSGGRVANSLAGAVPAVVFAIGTVGALSSGRALAAMGGLALTAAFTTLGVRSFQMRVETTSATLTVHGLLRTRRIARDTIVGVNTTWTSYAAALSMASGGKVPSVRWRRTSGRIRETPIWALAVNSRGPARWRSQTEAQYRQLQKWVHADETYGQNGDDGSAISADRPRTGS